MNTNVASHREVVKNQLIIFHNVSNLRMVLKQRQ